jgi:hypothetical protein
MTFLAVYETADHAVAERYECYLGALLLVTAFLLRCILLLACWSTVEWTIATTRYCNN